VSVILPCATLTVLFSLSLSAAMRCFFMPPHLEISAMCCLALTGLRASSLLHSYNIGVLRIKSESAQGAGENEVRSSSTEESLFWSEEAAKFFTGSSQKVHHAASKSLSAKARMMLNDLENAHRDLQVANGLNPTTKSLMLELQCLTCMNQ
jgi:hypothetical protein